MKLEEKLHKEIDLIQDCIKRMANNSFLLKGWAISLIGIIVALADKEINKIFLGVVTLIIAIIFWILDAYFLRIERMYRKMYDWVINERIAGRESCLYNLNPYRFEKDVGNLLKVMFSYTLALFYGLMLLIIVLFLFIYFYNNYIVSRIFNIYIIQ